MVINLNEQYNDILLLAQAHIVVWFDGIIIVHDYYPFNYVLFCVWWPDMAINVSVQYSDGYLPDNVLLTQGHYDWGTHLNAMKW